MNSFHPFIDSPTQYTVWGLQTRYTCRFGKKRRFQFQIYTWSISKKIVLNNIFCGELLGITSMATPDRNLGPGGSWTRQNISKKSHSTNMSCFWQVSEKQMVISSCNQTWRWRIHHLQMIFPLQPPWKWLKMGDCQLMSIAICHVWWHQRLNHKDP